MAPRTQVRGLKNPLRQHGAWASSPAPGRGCNAFPCEPISTVVFLTDPKRRIQIACGTTRLRPLFSLPSLGQSSPAAREFKALHPSNGFLPISNFLVIFNNYPVILAFPSSFSKSTPGCHQLYCFNSLSNNLALGAVVYTPLPEDL